MHTLLFFIRQEFDDPAVIRQGGIRILPEGTDGFADLPAEGNQRRVAVLQRGGIPLPGGARDSRTAPMVPAVLLSEWTSSA